jgi:hypothetical protein
VSDAVANADLPAPRQGPEVSELANNPKPSPEIEQLVLFGRIDEAVALYAKQAEVDQDTARAVIDALVAA